VFSLLSCTGFKLRRVIRLDNSLDSQLCQTDHINDSLQFTPFVKVAVRGCMHASDDFWSAVKEASSVSDPSCLESSLPWHFHQIFLFVFVGVAGRCSLWRLLAHTKVV